MSNAARRGGFVVAVEPGSVFAAVRRPTNSPTPLTRHFSYRSDILSRLAPLTELIECHSPCKIRSLAEDGRLAPILLRRLAYNFTYLLGAPGQSIYLAPLLSWRSRVRRSANSPTPRQSELPSIRELIKKFIQLFLVVDFTIAF